MGHEIKSADKLLLSKAGGVAWHGLGILFDGEKTPREAAQEVFPWTVIQKPLTFKDPSGSQQIVEGMRINVRSDPPYHQLGTVSDNYQVIQPLEMADFCEALADQGQVKIETAGSIRNGGRLWFLLKGDAFKVALGDEILPYILVSNGYDGGSSFRVTPTTVRVVCSNTLHAVIPRKESGELVKHSIAIRHTSNIQARIEEARLALANYGKAIETTKELINTLSSVQVNGEQVKQFFLDCYQSQIQEIPANPKDGFEERRRAKAMSAFESFSRRFDDEKGIAGTTLWCAANAFSGLVQHDLKARGSDDVARVEHRVTQNLFGLGADRTHAAFQTAFRMALAQ